MTTVDFITELFCRVEEQLDDKKHSQAKLYPIREGRSEKQIGEKANQTNAGLSAESYAICLIISGLCLHDDTVIGQALLEDIELNQMRGPTASNGQGSHCTGSVTGCCCLRDTSSNFPAVA